LVQTKKENIPNDQTLYQTAIKYTKWPQNIPNGHKIYQHFLFQGRPKFTQIGIFGLKRNHLATLLLNQHLCAFEQGDERVCEKVAQNVAQSISCYK
jgi:hypothetical protein